MTQHTPITGPHPPEVQKWEQFLEEGEQASLRPRNEQLCAGSPGLANFITWFGLLVIALMLHLAFLLR